MMKNRCKCKKRIRGYHIVISENPRFYQNIHIDTIVTRNRQNNLMDAQGV
jgi:hypothetical protein